MKRTEINLPLQSQHVWMRTRSHDQKHGLPSTHNELVEIRQSGDSRETFALHQQAPSEHISPSPHCHPLGTKWVGLKRLDHLELSEQSSLGSAAPHPASGVTSAHQLTHLVADWHQSTCWVGLVKTKFVDPNTYQLPCKNHLDKKTENTRTHRIHQRRQWRLPIWGDLELGATAKK